MDALLQHFCCDCAASAAASAAVAVMQILSCLHSLLENSNEISKKKNTFIYKYQLHCISLNWVMVDRFRFALQPSTALKCVAAHLPFLTTVCPPLPPTNFLSCLPDYILLRSKLYDVYNILCYSKRTPSLAVACARRTAGTAGSQWVPFCCHYSW